ncbi:MAG TPA: hypothetical protein VEX86_25415 [Longimicrobium sp.]|nr:hypothetical protein [Longimicrobium sp.]
MTAPAAFAARPLGEMEWEELLVRYEITPRALNAALDDGDTAGPARERLRGLLGALVRTELRTAALFEAMRSGAALDAGVTSDDDALPEEPRAIRDQFARLRARNFAAVQRRGLEVWDWRTHAGPDGEVSAYQVIQASCALDGETLAGIREALRGAVA